MSKDPKEFARKFETVVDLAREIFEDEADVQALKNLIESRSLVKHLLARAGKLAIVATPEGLSAIKPSIESTQKYLGGIPMFLCQTLDLAKIQQAELLDDGYSLVYVIDQSIEWDDDWQVEMNDEFRRLRDDAIKEHAAGLTVHLFPEDDEQERSK